MTSLNVLSMCLLIVELRFDAMLCSNTGKENSDAGQIKCPHGPQVPHPCFTLSAPYVNQSLKNWIRSTSFMRASFVDQLRGSVSKAKSLLDFD